MIFAAFLSYVIITSFTPGPSNMLVMNEARRFGFKEIDPFLHWNYFRIYYSWCRDILVNCTTI